MKNRRIQKNAQCHIRWSRACNWTSSCLILWPFLLVPLPTGPQVHIPGNCHPIIFHPNGPGLVHLLQSLCPRMGPIIGGVSVCGGLWTGLWHEGWSVHKRADKICHSVQWSCSWKEKENADEKQTHVRILSLDLAFDVPTTLYLTIVLIVHLVYGSPLKQLTVFYLNSS